MKVYIVFKTVMNWNSAEIIDSVWRDINSAYERLQKLKEGGHIEMHEVKRARQ